MTQPNQFLYQPPGGPSIGPGEGQPFQAVSATAGANTPGMDQDQQNAYTLLIDMLTQWGLSSLAPDVLKLMQDGYTQNQIPVLLQNTDAYKQRFRGNELRKQAGYGVLSPAEYLQTERSYRQIMMAAGLPQGFYDSPDDYAGWIGGDTSPVEVQRRVDEATDAAHNADENTKQVWASMGLAPGDLVPWILDQTRGRDELNRIIRGGRVAGAAKGYDVNLTREQTERFGQMAGQDYVKQGDAFGRLAGAGQRLSGFYNGPDYTAEEAAQEVFGANTEAQKRRERLFALEQGEFAGQGGSGRSGLSQGTGNF